MEEVYMSGTARYMSSKKHRDTIDRIQVLPDLGKEYMPT